MPERVALFTGNYNHIVDGVSLTLNRLVAYLESQGTQVIVFGPTTPDPPLAGGPGTFVPVASLPLPGRSEYRFTLWPSAEVRSRIERFQPQLIHVATPDVLGICALRMARRWDLPAVATYHTHFASYLKHYRLGWLEGLVYRYLRWFYRQCDHVYVPTEPILETLAELGLNSRLKVWGRGVDTERFHPRWRSEAWRREIGVGPQEVLVAFVGRLVWEKGMHIFADVMERLRDCDLPVRSLVVGEGPVRGELERRMPEAIFAGHLKGEALSRVYASSDVFLYPSDSEAFGNVIVEAMASGLAVVAAGEVGSSAHIEHERTGLLAPPYDAEAFRQHTARLVEDAGLRQRLGQAARKQAGQYDWGRTLARMERYYEEALAEHGQHQGQPVG